jgi:hypothetical protein
MLRRLLAVLVVTALGCAFTSAAGAAAPRYIMVSGKGPGHVMLANWRENLAIEMEIANAPRAKDAAAGLSARPRLRLSLFWGWGTQRPQWPGQANQRGWFYPAVGSQPALVALTVNGHPPLRVATSALLRILARHRVPVRSPFPAP